MPQFRNGSNSQSFLQMTTSSNNHSLALTSNQRIAEL